LSSAPAHSNLKELLERGDANARAGDVRAATSFYQAALQAARQLGSADAATQQALQSAAVYLREQAEAYKAALRTAVANRPVDDERTDRLRHAVDMLLGEREIFPQGPTVFYFPYLAQRQFFEREEFDWVPEFEAATPAIKAELEALLEQGADFQPYIEYEQNRPHREFHGLHGNESWTALYLVRDGKLVEEIAARCPATMTALDKVPLSRIGSRTPSVLFSKLTPGAHIPPHRGMLNCRLICHLPLIVPEGCWLRVGNETRSWREGRLMIFDDSIQHEARNDSGETRIVLLFDIWRPELSDDERAGISAVFDTIDRFTTLPDA